METVIILGIPVCIQFELWSELKQPVRITSSGFTQIIVNPLVPSIPPGFRANTTFFSGASTFFTVLPAGLDALRLQNPVTAELQVGQAVPVVIEAVDEFGNVLTDQDFDIELSDLSGTLWPKSGSLVLGTVELDMQVFQEQSNNIIFVKAPSNGLEVQSNLFNVIP